MGKPEVLLAIKSVKIKNCEGYDRIPQIILIDGTSVPIKGIFLKICNQRSVVTLKNYPNPKKGP